MAQHITDKMILFRRHRDDCKHAPLGRQYLKCKCPIWSDGMVNGKRQLRSMKTTDWDRAERMLGDQDPSERTPATKRKLLDLAVADYLADCETRSAPNTTASYRHILGKLQAFATTAELKYVDQITLHVLTQFKNSMRVRGTEKPAVNTYRKDRAGIRWFFCFCKDRNWIDTNPTTGLKVPKEKDPNTLPFDRAEIARLLDGISRVRGRKGGRTQLRLRAAVLMLLYSGLRASDVAGLERSKIDLNTGRMFVRMMKTNKPLYLRLHQDAVDALKALPVENPKYFFWSGNGKRAELSCRFGPSLRTLARVSNVSNVHPHRFRDTFAVGLLDNEVHIEVVQKLLGHTDLKTTQKYYDPWIESRQRQLDEATATLDFSTSSRPLQNELVVQGSRNPQSDIHALSA